MNRVYPLPRIEPTSLGAIIEERPVALVTDGPAWAATNSALNLPVVWRAEPEEATAESFAALAEDASIEAKVVYAVGGGLAFDAAKYIAHALDLPLLGVPTALSVDAPLTPASGVRRDGCVFYVQTGAPQTLFVDWDLIAAAPPYVRAAAVCDLLSISTALWDWHFADSEGKLGQHEAVVPYVARLAREILDETILLCPRLGRGEVEALERLLTLLGLEVQLCNFIGHSRPEEGSEHYFAYSVENIVGSGLAHAELVGPGIVAMAAAQGQEAERLAQALDSAGLTLHSIPRVAAEHTFKRLSEYATRHSLPFGVAHVFDEKRRGHALWAAW